MRRLALALALLAAVGAGLLLAALPARAQDLHPALGELASCVRQHAALDVLMLFDGSGSLRRTDPHGQRFTAAQVALTQLDRVAVGQMDGQRVAVRIRIAQFAGDYSAPSPWRSLDGTPGAVQDDIAQMRRTTLPDRTDYEQALTGAQQTLAGSDAPCRALLWFTDGKYEPLPDNASTAAQQAAANDGVGRLCAPNAMIDQLRAHDVTIVAVGLASQLDGGDQQRLRQLAGDPGGTVASPCGTPTPAATSPGTYLPAQEDTDLITAFADFAAAVAGGADTAGCANVPGGCTFRLAPPLSSFAVLIRTSASGDLTLSPPNLPPIVLDRSALVRSANVGASRIYWTWPAPDVVWVSGLLAQRDSSVWAGTWTARFPAKQSGTGRVYLITGLTPTVIGTTPPFYRGRPWKIRIGIGGADPDVLRAVDGLDPTLEVTFRDPNGQEQPIRAAVVPGPEPGTFDVTAAPPATWSAPTVRVEASLTVPVAGSLGLHPPPLITQFAVHAAVTIEPGTLSLPTLIGTGHASAQVTVRTLGERACVWFDAAHSQLRNPVGTVTASVTGLGTDEAGCVPLAMAGARTVTIRLDARHAAWSGDLRGTLYLDVRTADAGAPVQRIAIPVTTHQDQGRPPPGVFLVVAVLALGSLGPVVLLWLFNWWVLARFDRRALRLGLRQVDAEQVDGSVRLSTPGSGTEWTGEVHLVPLVCESRSLRLGRRTQFRIRPPWNVFDEPVAVKTEWDGGAGRTLGRAGSGLRSRPVNPRRLEVPLTPMVLVRPLTGSDTPANPARPREGDREPIAPTDGGTAAMFDLSDQNWLDSLTVPSRSDQPAVPAGPSTLDGLDAAPPERTDHPYGRFEVAVLCDFHDSVAESEIWRQVLELVQELSETNLRRPQNHTN